MIAIFDLDYTLFDSKRFMDECLAPFFGMSAAEFGQYYQKNFRVKGRNFHPSDLLEEKGLAETLLDEYLGKKINEYFLPEAEKILKLFRKKSQQLILVSFGNKDWQKKKIDQLIIGGQYASEFFDKIILEDKDKSSNKVLTDIKGDEILIINDNAAESQKMLKIFEGRARLFLIEGPYSDGLKKAFKSYKNLVDLGREIFPESYS